jgi:hypothetical protein
MKPTDYDMVKLALNSVDLVILRSLAEQVMKRRPDTDWQRLDLLTRARDLLAEFYQGNGHGRESLASRERGPALTPMIGVLPKAEPLRAYGACSDHFSRITPRRRFLSGRTK